MCPEHPPLNCSLLYQNVRGLNTKVTEFYTNCCVSDVDVILLTETWLTSSVLSGELFPASFNVFRCDRAGGRGGGVLAAISSRLYVKDLNLMSPVPSLEVLGVKITRNCVKPDQCFTVVVLYIPPSFGPHNYAELFDYLESNLDFANPVLICGDFNIPEFIKASSKAQSSNVFNAFMHFASLNNLTQHNNVLNANERILDLVLATDDLKISVTKYELPLVSEDCHHPCLNITLCDGIVSNSQFLRNPEIARFKFRSCNLENLYVAVCNIDWSTVLNSHNVNSACNEFYDILFNVIDACVPKSLSTSKACDYPVWFTRSIIDKIKIKNKHWNTYRKTKSLFHLDRVKSLRRDIRKEARTEYLLFIDRTERSLKHDPKKFWNFIDQKKRSTSVPGHMVNGDKVLTTRQDIVDAFAKHFASVFIDDNRNHSCDAGCRDFSESACEQCGKCCCDSNGLKLEFDNFKTTLSAFCIVETDILKAAKKIKANNVCGPDNLPAFFVVDCIRFLSTPLLHIFNLILNSCVYPDMWRVSKVFPVYKSAERSAVTNYRPIALLSNFSKLFECILSNFIYAHVINSISPYQHGFIRGRSTCTNLCEFTQFVSAAMDSRLQVDAIYTDLTKAFDRVHHCILLKKLKYFGICEQIVLLVKSLLVGRTQFVEYRGVRSPSYYVGSGVVQGSNLGPLLFLIFYNDVVNSISSNVYIYADDLKLARIIKCAADCFELQKDIDNLNLWCEVNKLTLNTNKCKKISFTRNNSKISFYYNVCGYPLTNSDEITDLGVIVDNHLTFVPHILHIANSAMKILGFIIRNTRDFTRIDCVKLLFYSLVRSKLEYCSVIWKPYHQTYIDLLESVLRKFAKHVHFKMLHVYPERHCSQAALLNTVNECSLYARRNVFSLIFVQKIVNGNISSDQLLSQVGLVVPRPSGRNSLTFHYNIPRTYHHLNSPMLHCFRLYNRLCNSSYDIFHDDFSHPRFKKALILMYDGT